MANFVGATRPGASVHTAFTGDTSGLRNAVNQATGMLRSFGNQMKNATAGIATVFGVGAIANSFGNFLSDSVKLASTMQGVEEAFKRIARPGLLREYTTILFHAKSSGR